jgi:hypothetical protein
MKRNLYTIAILLLVAVPDVASAQLITFQFTGTVADVSGVRLGAGPFTAGQMVSGSYTFDAAALDELPWTDVLASYRAVTSFQVSIPAAAYAASGSPATSLGFIGVVNNHDGIRDEYVVLMSAPQQTLTGTAVADLRLDSLSIVLRDRTSLALTSDALPLVPPALSNFTFGTELFIDFVGPSGTETVYVTLTSLTGASATTLLEELVGIVMQINVNSGISNSLDGKIASVMRAIDDTNEKNDVAALNAMFAFINVVEAQKGKKLTDAQADRLLEIAAAIVSALSR